MMHDPKLGEREYFARIGEAGRAHALKKPFGDEFCAQYLTNISALLLLMRPPPARIVEFGCGTGWLSLIFAERGYEVLGIDISPEAIALAEHTREGKKIAHAVFRVADYEDAGINPPADYVVFHDALHHAESETASLRAAYEALAPGGMAICIEPGEGHSRSQSSVRAVAEFGVHEKDMPPQHIIRHARLAGFSRNLVLPWPMNHMRHIYRTAYGNPANARDLRGRKFLGALRAVRNLFFQRTHGVVLLFKD